MKSFSGDNYVSKRFYYAETTCALKFISDGVDWVVPGSPMEVREVLKEYAFAKICSKLGVGVRTGCPDHPFDLVSY